MPQQSGGTVPVKSSRACVVYDTHTGHVQHIHQVVTFEGGREPTEAEIEAHAISIAQREERHKGTLKVLHVATEAIQPGHLYAVDLKSNTLVAKKRK